MAGLTEVLREHGRVAIDTPVFIYHIEGSSQFGPPAHEAFAALEAGEFDAVTSNLTLMEIAVRPLRLGRPEVADEYEVLLANFPHLAVVDLDRRTARRAAELRAEYGLRPADALQLAAGLRHGASAFLTNDHALRRVADIPVLLLGDFL